MPDLRQLPSNLATLVFEIRTAIGDDPHAPRDGAQIGLGSVFMLFRVFEPAETDARED